MLERMTKRIETCKNCGNRLPIVDTDVCVACEWPKAFIPLDQISDEDEFILQREGFIPVSGWTKSFTGSVPCQIGYIHSQRTREGWTEAKSTAEEFGVLPNRMRIGTIETIVEMSEESREFMRTPNEDPQN